MPIPAPPARDGVGLPASRNSEPSHNDQGRGSKRTRQGGHTIMTEAPQRLATRPTAHRISRRRALVASSVGLAAAGAGPLLSRTDAAMAGQATPAPEAAPGTVTAARVAQAVEQIPNLVAEILNRTGVPGMAVAVVYDDTIQYVGGFGVRELGEDAPIDAETVFQLASVSKSLSATVVASVVGT